MSSSQPEEPKLETTEVGRSVTMADSMEGGGSSMATELATNDQLSVINISSSSSSSSTTTTTTTTTTTSSSLLSDLKQQCDSVIDSANDVTLATMTSTETLNSGDINNNKLTMVAATTVTAADDNNSDIVEGISSISISKFEDDEVPPIITNELSTSASSSSSSILSSTSTLKDTGEQHEDDDQKVEQPPVRKFILEPMMKSKDDEEEVVSPTAIQSKASNVAMVAPLSSPSSDSESSQHSSSSAAAGSQEYHLKWIKWKGNKVPIVTQNSNGPCPLLAIINVLLLRKNICFPPMIEIITASQLMEYLCDHMLNNVPKNLSESARLNYEQNFQDALSVLPRLPTGLDVNVRFTGFSDFEYTPECIIFDLLRISLYHGWLVDPSDREIFRIVNTLSYNQLVDRIITSKGNSTSSTDMFIAEEFLNQTASQLTNYGLLQLIKLVKEDELCILFRNNHFITLYKYKSKLFQLVTDQGFLTESNVVWETLTNIEGDSRFMDGDFVLVPPKPVITAAVPAVTAASSASMPFTNTQQQIDQDYLIALSLEQEQKLTANQQPVTNPANSSLVEYRAPSVGNHLSSTTNRSTASASAPNVQLSDEELARKLQQEEDQRSYELMQQQQQQHQNRSNAIAASSPNYKSFPSGRTPVQTPMGVSHPKSSHSSSSTTSSSSSSHHQFQQQQQDLHSRNSRHSSRNRTTSLGSGSSTTTTNQPTGASGGAGSGRSSTGSNHRSHHQQSHHSASSNSDNNPNNDRDSVSSRESKSKNCTIS